MNILALLFINKTIILKLSTGYWKLCAINQNEIKHINELACTLPAISLWYVLNILLWDLRLLLGLSRCQYVVNFTRVVSWTKEYSQVDLLTAWNRVHLENLTVHQPPRNTTHFMEPEISLPLSQVPATCPILSQLESVHASTSYFLKTDLITTIRSTPGYSKWSRSLRFPYQNLVYVSPLPHTCSMFLYSLYIYWKREQVTKLLIMQSYAAPVNSSLWGPNNVLKTEFSHTLWRLTRANKNCCRKCI